MAYDLIKVSALPATTPSESQDIVIGEGDYLKRINYGDVKNDMVGTSPSYTTDTEPYLTRQTANVGVVGKCALNKLVGGSLGWNQLCKYPTTQTVSGVTVTNNGTKLTLNNTATALITLSLDTLTIPTHVYYADKGSSATNYRLYNYGNGVTTGDEGRYVLGRATGSVALTLRIPSGAAFSNLDIVPKAIDLTQMFGSTIADYVYSLGETNGMAWLRKYIDIDSYHTYDAGSIQSVQATAHVTKDANDNVIGTYPLGSDTLRGIPQLVSNKLAFDGDIKTPDGTITRKYGYVDLGTLDWTYYSASTWFYTNPDISDIKPVATVNDVAKMICAPYRTTSSADMQTASAPDMTIAVNQSGRITIRDTRYTTATAFTTAMSGVYLVYELVTPTTESSTAYQKIQTIDADGTESFTTSSPVPVGHETQTPDNILAALEWLGE